MPMPKKRLSAASAAFGDGGIHTQWPKIIAKLFMGRPLWLRGCGFDRTIDYRKCRADALRPAFFFLMI
jgi:hypothetical protein